MSVRIISGQYRGASISVPRSARPTLSRTRQSLFDLLESSCLDRDVGEFFLDRIVLDCFAGAGALGLEALSRGAKYAFFVDNDGAAIKTLRSNIAKLHAEEKSYVIFSEIQKIKPLHVISKNKNTKCDVVFLDPPYAASRVIPDVIDHLLQGEWLTKNAVFVIEVSAEFDFSSDFIDKFEVIKSKQIASSKFVIAS